MIVKESREELMKLLSKPRKYMSKCPFCGKEMQEHSNEELEICVTKKLIAQGILPSGTDSNDVFHPKDQPKLSIE